MHSPELLLQGLSVTLQHLGWRKTASGVYRFRCPYCQHDIYAPRYVHKGYLHPEKGSPGRWRFKCHRCGMAATLLDFVREHAAHLLLPSPEVFEVPPQESIDACGDEERVTRLPPQKGIYDALWRSRHLPRHLCRGNRRIIRDEHQVHDE